LAAQLVSGFECDRISIMFPLHRVAAGLLIALLALRINGFDLLVDAVGWFLVYLGLSSMQVSVDPAFGKVQVSAVVAGALSLAAIVGLTAEPAVGLLYTLSANITIWLLASVIIARARTFGDSATASAFNILRWILATTAAVNSLGGYLSVDLGAVGISLILSLVALVWFVVQLYRSARLPYLVRHFAETPIPNQPEPPRAGL
jgi:hypothetical protein